MEQALPRIEPELATIAGARGTHRVAEIRLGSVPRGAVMVLSEPGRFDEAAEVMNGLAHHGYESVATEGSGVEVASLLTHLADRGWDAEQVGLVGYGASGQAVVSAASEFALGAAVSIGPTGSAADLLAAPAPLRTPWLGMLGGDDDERRPAAVRELRRALYERSPVHTELVCYPGVGRRFYRDSWHAAEHAAAFDCWQRTVEWLDLRVVPRLTPLARAWFRRLELTRADRHPAAPG